MPPAPALAAPLVGLAVFLAAAPTGDSAAAEAAGRNTSVTVCTAPLAVSAALIDALESLDLHFPKVGDAALAEMQQVRAALLAEGQGKNSKNNK